LLPARLSPRLSAKHASLPSGWRNYLGLIATWKEVSIDYGLLWEKDARLADNGTWDEFEALKRREKTIDESEFPKTKSKLLEKAFHHVCRKRGLA
jgi:hypothetical protein